MSRYTEILLRKAVRRLRNGYPLSLDLAFKLASEGINIEKLEEKHLK